MFAPMTPKSERVRFRTEREYREWQMSLRNIMPAKRNHTGPSFLARVANKLGR